MICELINPQPAQRTLVAMAALLFSSASAWATVPVNACDLNSDGVVNVLDVQLAINMDLGVLKPCSANGFGVCDNSVVNSVVTAALGGACVLTSGITFVQGNYATPQTPQTVVNVTFTAEQLAGDLNVVVVGWNDSTATISAVTDQSGNTYTRAVGPTVQSGLASQSIYYAKNIALAAAGANTVTVTFSSAAVSADLRILEYSGADLNNPVDVTAASTGNSSTSDSGSVATTNPTDLLFAANLVQNMTSGPGSGFTSRLLTQPDGDIAEDEMVTATGTYSATAPLGSSNSWIMQMVAFRTPVLGAATGPTTPTNLTTTGVSSSQINLTWTASTDNVGVTGYLVERCQGAGCTNFAQIAAPSGTSFNDTGLPSNITYSYRVRATDGSGNLSPYSNVSSATTLASTSHSVALTWTASTTPNIAGYNIYRSTISGGSYMKLNSSLVVPTAYTDSTVVAGQTYFYVATAVDTSGNESVYSTQVQAVIPTP